MNKLKKILLLNVALGFSAITFGQDGQAIFSDNCTVCHTIGNGKLVGPDLKGVHEKRNEQWLISFIKDSQGFIASGDADAKAIFDEFGGTAMPAFSMSDDEVKSIIAYIGTHGSADAPVASAEGEGGEEAVAPQGGFSTDSATQDDIDRGMALFTGNTSLMNGGVACVTCHNVFNDDMIGGGKLAKDLTFVHGRMGDPGISGMLTAPPFPAMAQAYKNRPLTEDEIFQLAAFFRYSNEKGYYQHPRTWDWVFVFGGGTILFCFLTWLFFVYFKRKTKSTKHDILARQGYYDKTK